jgi:F-type H+-transporting ATPase subunit b
MRPSAMKRQLSLLGLFLALLSPNYSWAASGGGGGSRELIWQMISFALLLAFLIQALKKPLRYFLLRRHEAIRNSLDQASQKEEKAQALFQIWTQKVEALSRETTELHEQIRQEGQRERERIVSRAREESERLRKQAQMIAEQEVKKARLVLKKEVVDLSVSLAEEILKQTTQPEDQDRLVREYIGKVRQLQ